MPKATSGNWASLLLDLSSSLCFGFTIPRLICSHAHGCAADTCMRCGLSIVQATHAYIEVSAAARHEDDLC